MSVIACKVSDGKIEIAADSISVAGWTQSKGENLRTSKLFKCDNLIVGHAGYAETGTMMQMYIHNHKPRENSEYGIVEFMVEFHEWKDKKNAQLNGDAFIMIFKNKINDIKKGYF